MHNFERLDRMKRAMEMNSLDVLILRLPENVLLLSGYWPMIGATVLIFPKEGPSICITPACYKAEVEASNWSDEVISYPYGTNAAGTPSTLLFMIISDIAKKKRWKRIGLEGDFETVAPSWNSAEAIVPAAGSRALLTAVFPSAELLDATPMLMDERRRKTYYEVKRLRLASEIATFGLEAFEAAAKVGATGVELAAEVERAIMVRGTGHKGAVRVRGYAQVSTGADETGISYRPNIISTARRLAESDLAVLELGVVVDGYWSDRTRVLAVGTPKDEQIKIYNTVMQAQEAAIAALRPGVKASEVDAAARHVIVEAGYGPAFPHFTGHGLGFSYHESAPILGINSTDVLEEGMLTSVEPGIYIEGVGGIRIEDDVLVTSTGSEVLGPYKKVLQA